VLSGRGLCTGLITRPEEYCRLWRVFVCDQETSKTRRLKPATGLWKIKPQWVVTPGKQTATNIYSERLLEESDKEENLTVNGACYYLLFEKKTVKRSAQCHVFAQSQPGRRPNYKYPSTLRTASCLCKNVSVQCCLVATVIHIQSVRSQKCVYLHTSDPVSHRPISLSVP
jgi:hypothetical protein